MPLVLNNPAEGDTLQTLIDELKARGYDYLSDERATRLINWAYRELAAGYQWPFLEQIQDVVSGTNLPDAGLILSVADSSTAQPVRWVDRRHLVRYGIDLSSVED